MMVDPDRLRRLLQTLERFTTELDSLAREDRDTYVREHGFAGRYLVQAAAQTCIDIANHVIASEGWRTPRDFHDALRAGLPDLEAFHGRAARLVD